VSHSGAKHAVKSSETRMDTVSHGGARGGILPGVKTQKSPLGAGCSELVVKRYFEVGWAVVGGWVGATATPGTVMTIGAG
jgi:hypothetical protein